MVHIRKAAPKVSAGTSRVALEKYSYSNIEFMLGKNTAIHKEAWKK